jgi:mitochondrial fission protein ELM1
MERSAHGPAATAWTVSDGRAGNRRQAQALAAAMGLDAIDWRLEARAPWRWLAPRLVPGAGAAFGMRFRDALHAPPTLAIGCGRQAALATRVLRGRGTRVVQVLDPRLAPSHWDVVVAPAHDGLRGDNVVTLLGSLNPVDDAWLARARADFPAFALLPRPRIALLLGGPTTRAAYDAAAVQAWLRQVGDVVERERGSLLLVASPRTPQELRVLLRQGRGAAPGTCWVDAADGDNPYAGVLAWADRIACSPDSVNMLSEACATRAPVFVAGTDAAQGRVRDFLAALAARGRVRRLDRDLEPFHAEPLRETQRVAVEVAAFL